MKAVLVYCTLFISLFLSCKKNEEQEDTVNPTIAFTSPSNGDIFIAGETIRVNATVTDDKGIAEIHLHVTNLTTGALLMDVHQFPNSTSAVINQTLTAVASTNYRIQVIAKDKSVNESRASVDVFGN